MNVKMKAEDDSIRWQQQKSPENWKHNIWRWRNFENIIFSISRCPILLLYGRKAWAVWKKIKFSSSWNLMISLDGTGISKSKFPLSLHSNVHHSCSWIGCAQLKKKRKFAKIVICNSVFVTEKSVQCVNEYDKLVAPAHILQSIDDKSSHTLVERKTQVRGIAISLRVLWSVARSRTNEKKWKVSKSIGGVWISWWSRLNKLKKKQVNLPDYSMRQFNHPIKNWINFSWVASLTHLKLIIIIQSLLKDIFIQQKRQIPSFQSWLTIHHLRKPSQVL